MLPLNTNSTGGALGAALKTFHHIYILVLVNSKITYCICIEEKEKLLLHEV